LKRRTISCSSSFVNSLGQLTVGLALRASIENSQLPPSKALNAQGGSLKKNIIHNKKKRLRKKLFLGEFAIYGFKFDCKVNLKSEAEVDQFLDEIIDLAVSRKLQVGGGGGQSGFGMFVCSEHNYGSATEEDREIFKEWLTNHKVVSDLKISQIIDANYGI